MKLDMLGIITANFDEMKKFYMEVLSFKPQLELESYVEFENAGIRFALSTTAVMEKATGEKAYLEKKKGHSFELAFRCQTEEELEKNYKEITEKGAKAIKAPEAMPWGQKTAFFADPDGNIHELFVDL